VDTLIAVNVLLGYMLWYALWNVVLIPAIKQYCLGPTKDITCRIKSKLLRIASNEFIFDGMNDSDDDDAELLVLLLILVSLVLVEEEVGGNNSIGDGGGGGSRSMVMLFLFL
jgi:hypothetical protein